MTASPATEAVAVSTTASVLTDLAWETLANDLEDWLDAGHRPPLPAALDARPAGTPPEHLQRRMINLSTRLSVVLRDMHIERRGLETSLKATAQAQRMTTAARGATASYLDTGA